MKGRWRTGDDTPVVPSTHLFTIDWKPTSSTPRGQALADLVAPSGKLAFIYAHPRLGRLHMPHLLLFTEYGGDVLYADIEGVRTEEYGALLDHLASSPSPGCSVPGIRPVGAFIVDLEGLVWGFALNDVQVTWRHLHHLLRHGAEGWDVERQRTAWANLTATAWAML